MYGDSYLHAFTHANSYRYAFANADFDRDPVDAFASRIARSDQPAATMKEARRVESCRSLLEDGLEAAGLLQCARK